MLADLFKNKVVLVTGGTGSIGSVIVEEVLRYEPGQIRIFSRDETKQLELWQRLNSDPRVSLLIGDVRDKDRLNLAMENVNIVFHAAAIKHVYACENNPFEAVKTNVNGTQNVIDCAFANSVDKVIGISTDKATDPTNVMGCTKLLAEKMMLASYNYKGYKKTKFCFVRFGNVLFSRGSVVPLFIKQIKKGGPVTITDERMTRFVMSTQAAVRLVCKAAALMYDREIFILKMPVLRIADLARAVIDHYAPRLGVSAKNIMVTMIGKRNGERLHEKLLTLDEAESALETDELFILVPVNLPQPALHFPGARPAAPQEFSSQNQSYLGLDQIADLLTREAAEIPSP